MKKFLATSALLVGLSFSIHAQEHAAPKPTTPANPPRTVTDTGGWVPFTSDAGRYSVLLPVMPETKVETTPSKNGPYVTTLSISKNSSNVYLVGFVDYDPSFNFNRREELEANRDNFIKGLNATLLSTQDLTIDGYSMIEFVAESTERVFSSRVYMVGRRPYQIAFIAPKGDNDQIKKNRFFNSFKINNAIATAAPKPTGTADSYYEQGEVLYKEKKYPEALDLYLKAVQVNPSMANALYRIGWIYNDREDYAAAIEPLKKAVSLLPNHTAAYFELGFANRKLNRMDEALKAFQQSVRIKPDYAAAHYQIGWIYNDQGRYNDAVTSLKLAVSYRSNYAGAHNELGYALHQLQRYAEAIQEYQTAIAQQADYASAIYNLGVTYISIKNRNGALEQYRLLQSIDIARATKLYDQIK